MAKRYYLSTLIGDGSYENQFRSVPYDYGLNHTTEFPPQDMTTGRYSRNQCLVIVDAVNHTSLLADLRMNAMPDFPLDGKLSAMRSATLSALNNAAAARGYAVTWGSADAYRDVVRSLGKQLNPNFSEDNFDVSPSV